MVKIKLQAFQIEEMIKAFCDNCLKRLDSETECVSSIVGGLDFLFYSNVIELYQYNLLLDFAINYVAKAAAMPEHDKLPFE